MAEKLAPSKVADNCAHNGVYSYAFVEVVANSKTYELLNTPENNGALERRVELFKLEHSNATVNVLAMYNRVNNEGIALLYAAYADLVKGKTPEELDITHLLDH